MEIRSDKGSVNASPKSSEKTVRLLRNLQFFSELKHELLVTLADACRVKYADAGEVLIDEAWPSSPGLYILTDGQVQVERRVGSERVVLAHRSEGESLGELSLLDGLPPSATVVAITEVEAILLPRDEFVACLDRSRSLSREIIRILAGRLRESNEGAVDRQTKDVRSRLAAELLQIVTRENHVSTSPIIRMDLSQAQMGAKLGVSRESINKALKSLQVGKSPPLVPFGKNRGAFRVNLEALKLVAS